MTVYVRHPRMTGRDLPPRGAAGPIAVFVPAWDEADVIGPMLRGCLDKWRGEDVQIFVGVSANDSATVAALADLMTEQGQGRITMVVNDRPGPTTKADCLNHLWRALERWEAAEGRVALCVVLHDAKDVVHEDELRVIGMLAPRFALVQLPVLPLVSAQSVLVAGHYCDEFAEAHAKSLIVREAIGAAMPSAGVGCGFSRAALGRIAALREGRPFDETSLTEDYELGLRVSEDSGRGIMVRMKDARGRLIATREYFPDTLDAAVRQKARWTIGIALAGWDRLGWQGSWRERWMRLRDRRSALAALVISAGYLGALLACILFVAAIFFGRAASAVPPGGLMVLLDITAVLLIWRMGVRMAFVWQAYGPWQALLSVPRTIIANIIAVMAARLAVITYVRHLRGQALVWDKTRHRFPDPSAPEFR